MVEDITRLGLDADILFVDDNSPDGTGKLLDEFGANHGRLAVVHRPGRLGIGSAHLAGVSWAYDHRYTRLITLDCDFTHSPADIPRLLEQAGDCDVVVGSRYLRPESLPGWNVVRRLLTNFGHLMTKRLLGIPFDATGAFRVYNLARIPRLLFMSVSGHGYSFFFESLFLLVRNGYSCREVAIVLPARTYGSSKMSMSEVRRSALRILRLHLATLLNPGQFRIVEPFTQIDPRLMDPQGWDEYWDKKGRKSGLVYDAIATVYRNLVIKRRLNQFIRKHFSRGSRLLHAGCGGGQVDSDIQMEMEITAIDISVSALAHYKRNNPRAREIRHASILDLPFAEASFDGAYNLGVVEHFAESEIRQILSELARVVEAGGKVVIFWPHRRASSVLVLRLAHWVANDVMKKKIRFHPPEISLLASRRSIEPLIQQAGLEIIEYYFGVKDLFVQAVLVLEKPESLAQPHRVE